MTTLAPAAAAPTRLLSRARFARRRATTSPARVVVRPRAATPQQPFWDNGPSPEDDRGPAHRGFTPVPGFGEYYTPPAAPKTKSPDGTPQPAPRRRSKLIDEPTAPSVWSPGDVGSAAAPVGGDATPPARGAFSRALDVVVGRTPDPPIAEATGYPQTRGGGEYDHDHDYDYAQSAVPGPDEELARLRSMYRLLRRMTGALRFLFPITGGLACWVAAGASFGGAFTTFIPFMVNAVNVLAFALASVVGAAMFTGGYILVALLARTLRLALFGDARGDVVDRAPPLYQYPTLPAPRETPRAKDPTYEVYEVETRGYAYDAPRGTGAGSGTRAGTGSGMNAGTYAASASAREREPAFEPEVASEPEPEVDDGEPFAARPPPKRKRVDLPIETLIGLGEGALVSVGSEWNRQRGYVDNGRGKSTTNGRAPSATTRSTETKTQTETRRGSEENARRQPPRENAAPAPVTRAPAQPPAPPPPPPPPPAPVAEERTPVSWDPAALMKDMGFGDDASSPSPAAASRPAEKEEKKGGWFGGWFGGGGQPEPDRTPPPQQPQSQTQRERPAPRASSADDFDPVMAMLSGGANANPNATNPNAARAAAAAAAPPSGRNFVEQASSTTGGGGGDDEAAEWAEMKARRDEWNRRVQRTVRKQQDEGEE